MPIDNRGEKNPMYGKKQTERTKFLIAKKARERFARGEHPRGMLGKNHSKETIERIKRTVEVKKRAWTGVNHYKWKGDAVKYKPLHKYIRKYLPMPLKCYFCGLNKRLEVHCKDKKYTRDLDTWVWICRGCHMKIHRHDSV